MSGVVHSTLLLTAANLAIRTVSMLFGIYLSDRLGAAGLGLIQLISSVSLLALTVGSSGIRIAAMYLCAEEHGRRRSGGVRSAADHCLAVTLLLSCLAGFFLILCSDHLAGRWLAEPHAASSLRLIGLFLPVLCMNSVMTGYFTACGKIRSMVAIEVGERILCILITVLLLRRASTAEAACLAFFCGSSLSCAASFLTMYAIYRRDCRFFAPAPKQIQMGRRLLRLCLPLAANEYLRSGLSTLENLLIPQGLRRYGASGEHAMATYGVIHGMVFPVLMFAAAILYSLSDVMVPELSRCLATDNRKRIHRLTDRCLRWGFVFSAGTAGLLFSLAEPLGQLLYHSEEAGLYLAMLSPMVLILYPDAIVDGMHKGLGQQLYCVRYNTLTSFLDVLFLFLLLPRYGIGGFLFSFTVTHLLNFWLSLRRLVRVTEYRLQLLFVPKVLLPAVFAAIPVRFLLRSGAAAPWPTVLLGCCYLLLYAALLPLFSVLSKEDRRWLNTLFFRKKIARSRSKPC
ncbi:MAG: polysaccharide biosynthesis C-terminal domain-containing protein [Oscillospiraceae bacterium]|nr:polysaccharide biosynthesis C-terminal domain-containing protein [Oscillospiraceae bacterium]